MAKSLWVMMLSLIITSSCRHADTRGAPSQPMGLAGAVCMRAPTVKFMAPKPTTKNAPPSMAAVMAAPKAPMRLAVSPIDLAAAKSIICGKDGICEAIINRPISIEKAVPVGLNTKIRLGYEQKQDKDGDICLRSVKVGGQFSPLSHCLGNLVYANIDVGVNVTQKVDEDAKEPELKAELHCRANVGCNTPFLNFDMTADDKGISFNTIASAKALTDHQILKKILPEKKVTSKVAYKELPDAIKKLKETVATVGDVIKDPDLMWNTLAESCDPRT